MWTYSLQTLLCHSWLHQINPYISSGIHFPNSKYRHTTVWLAQAHDITSHLTPMGNSDDAGEHTPNCRTASTLELRKASLTVQEFGKFSASLVILWYQVWLTQSTLPEVCMRTMCRLSCIPGLLFGPVVKKGLDRIYQTIPDYGITKSTK